MNKTFSFFKGYIKILLPFLVRILGIKILNKIQTKLSLSQFSIFQSSGYSFQFTNLVKDKIDFIFLNGESPSTNVYLLENIELNILPYAGLKIDKYVFDLDFGSSLFIKYFFPKNRELKKVDICIVLWSHEWGTGYYDFLFFVLMKLDRILSNDKQLEVKDAVISLPFNVIELPPYVNEYFLLYGFDKSKIIDSRKVKVIAEKYYFGDNNSFFFPNFFDVKTFKENLIQKFNSLIKSVDTNENKIYLKRSGRRKVINEAEIIPILEKFNFIILEDSPLSIFDQFNLFQSAKIILGPHGAGFSNILYCRKNTKIIEFFPKNYYPPYYFYLSGALGLDYYGFIENGAEW